MTHRLKTAEEWHAIRERDAREIVGFRGDIVVAGILADYRRLEEQYRHLMSIVLRVAALAAGEEQPASSWDAVCDQAMRVWEVVNQHEPPPADDEGAP